MRAPGRARLRLEEYGRHLRRCVPAQWFPERGANMSNRKTVPERLYKYRDFTSRTLDMLVGDDLYFADPGTFNDPLDTRPYLDIDVDDDLLEGILRTLVERRVDTDMRAAAKAMKVGGARTHEHIRRRARNEADRVIADIDYHARNPEYEPVAHKRELFRQAIQSEVLGRYDTGIVSLAERADCPLMWSHYGDQHRGICVGYSVPEDAAGEVRRVDYGGGRRVKVSQVAAMLGGNQVARGEVDDAVLLRKAESWRYEREWRLIGPRGNHGSRLDLKEVAFGMRCKEPVKYAVVKALEGRDRPVEFYELHETHDRFDLRIEPLNGSELCAFFPRRYRSMLEDFEIVPATTEESAE